MKRVRSGIIAAAGAAMFIAGAVPALASAQYEVVSLADGFGGFKNRFDGAPSVSPDGKAIFAAFPASGGNGLFTGPDPTADALVTTSDGFSGFGLFPARNASGALAFLASLPNGTKGIFLGTHPSDLAVADGATYSSIENPQMDDIGRAAFAAGTSAGHVIAAVDHVGGPVTILAQSDSHFDQIDSAYSYNHNHLLAFFAQVGGKTGLYLSTTGFADDAVLIAQEGGFITDLHENEFPAALSVNSHGQVAFEATLSDGTDAILTGGTEQDIYARTGGTFGRFVSNPLLREDGTVLFESSTSTESGIFDGPDASDLVLSTKEIADATGTGAFIMFLSSNIADDGTFAFTTRGNASDGEALAIPVPEPALVGLLIPGLLLLRRRNRSPR